MESLREKQVVSFCLAMAAYSPVNMVLSSRLRRLSSISMWDGIGDVSGVSVEGEVSSQGLEGL